MSKQQRTQHNNAWLHLNGAIVFAQFACFRGRANNKKVARPTYLAIGRCLSPGMMVQVWFAAGREPKLRQWKLTSVPASTDVDCDKFSGTRSTRFGLAVVGSSGVVVLLLLAKTKLSHATNALEKANTN